jgi:hypothetical protein
MQITYYRMIEKFNFDSMGNDDILEFSAATYAHKQTDRTVTCAF